jgi:hypothetical protein
MLVLRLTRSFLTPRKRLTSEVHPCGLVSLSTEQGGFYSEISAQRMDIEHLSFDGFNVALGGRGHRETSCTY